MTPLQMTAQYVHSFDTIEEKNLNGSYIINLHTEVVGSNQPQSKAKDMAQSLVETISRNEPKAIIDMPLPSEFDYGLFDNLRLTIPDYLASGKEIDHQITNINQTKFTPQSFYPEKKLYHSIDLWGNYRNSVRKGRSRKDHSNPALWGQYFRPLFRSFSYDTKTMQSPHLGDSEINKDHEPSRNLKQPISFDGQLSDFPRFFSISDLETIPTLDVFGLTSREENRIDEKTTRREESSSNANTYSFTRQRRLTTYVWEMTDFSDYVSDNTNDYFELIGYNGDPLKIVIKPLSSGSVATGTEENSTATQGVASNMPVYPDSGIWSPSTRTYNDFMKITGTLPSSITIDASAVKYFMNWHYGDWDVSTIDMSTNHYDLIYYSAVPEPSTYFMTGALVCLIGCNRSTRRSCKLVISRILFKGANKENCAKLKNWTS